MTPEERAEKVVKIFMGYEKADQASFYDQVLPIIREAEKEAYEKGKKDGDFLLPIARESILGLEALDREYLSGSAWMREEAAKYIEVNSVLRKSTKELADGIRAIGVEAK